MHEKISSSWVKIWLSLDLAFMNYNVISRRRLERRRKLIILHLRAHFDLPASLLSFLVIIEVY
jgi:hypothetical protein